MRPLSFNFLLYLRCIIEIQYIMKRVYKFLVMLVVAAVFSSMMTGCLRQDYLMFEDGEFDGIEFSDYDLMHNAELDMDDTDRD